LHHQQNEGSGLGKNWDDNFLKPQSNLLFFKSQHKKIQLLAHQETRISQTLMLSTQKSLRWCVGVVSVRGKSANDGFRGKRAVRSIATAGGQKEVL
jgi:hypothetical protein